MHFSVSFDASKESSDDRDFTITWTVTVTDSSAVNAARQAYGMMLDQDGVASVLRVTEDRTDRSGLLDVKDSFEADDVPGCVYLDSKNNDWAPPLPAPGAE